MALSASEALANELPNYLRLLELLLFIITGLEPPLEIEEKYTIQYLELDELVNLPTL